MRKLIATSLVLSSLALLSGCSLIYPNWGTSAKPSDSATASSSASASATPSDSASASASPSETSTAAPAHVDVLDVSVDAGQLSVIAEMTTASEDGGKCTLTFNGSGITKTLVVKAESNSVDTQCFPMSLRLIDLPSGKGIVSVAYSSANYAGKSSSVSVVIP